MRVGAREEELHVHINCYRETEESYMYMDIVYCRGREGE